MQAIIKNGGKQYKVKIGDIILLDKVNLEPKSNIEITEVLALIDGEKIDFGTPFLNNAKVKLEVINHGRARKVITFKKRRRKDSKTKRGFRRDFTRVRVVEIFK
ncbi:50S ribosomal protein L21 [Helicobacter sp. MIT 14-3879]|uniref:50S ribosomal protein L21 n=1 Tax=Helicobacter sp. MIT 14-3879 TaxID=2040649 RepID=UPI000E1F655C|nr:50S ribosomal protein L21 [Helicobacter sp. MIT 14-3879]RDU65447.1 50S ribosomal protein L21 [Helicobacter sp. MIT 14-3879]